MAFGAAVSQVSTLSPEEQEALAQQAAADQAQAEQAATAPPPTPAQASPPPAPAPSTTGTEAQAVANATVPADVAAAGSTAYGADPTYDPGTNEGYTPEQVAAAPEPSPATAPPPAPIPTLGPYGSGTKFTSGTMTSPPPVPTPYGPSSDQGYQTQLAATPTPSEFSGSTGGGGGGGGGSTSGIPQTDLDAYKEHQRQAEEAGQNIGLQGQAPAIPTLPAEIPPPQGVPKGWMDERRTWGGGPNIISEKTGYVPPEFTPTPVDPISPQGAAKGMGEALYEGPENLLTGAQEAAKNLPGLDWTDVGNAANEALGFGGFVGSQVQNEVMEMSPGEMADLTAGMLAGGAPARPGSPIIGGVEFGDVPRPRSDSLGSAFTGERAPELLRDIPMPRSGSRDAGGIKDLGGTRESDPTITATPQQRVGSAEAPLPEGARPGGERYPDYTGYFRPGQTMEPSARPETRPSQGARPGPPAREAPTGRPPTGTEAPAGAPAGGEVRGKTYRVWPERGATPEVKPTVPGGREARPAGDTGGEARPVPPEAPPKTVDQYIDTELARTTAQREKPLQLRQDERFEAQTGRAQDAWYRAGQESGGTTAGAPRAEPVPTRTPAGASESPIAATKPTVEPLVIDKTGVINRASPEVTGKTTGDAVRPQSTADRYIENEILRTKTQDEKPLQLRQDERFEAERGRAQDAWYRSGQETAGRAQPTGGEAAPVSPQTKQTIRNVVEDVMTRQDVDRTKPLSSEQREQAVLEASRRLEEVLGRSNRETPVSEARPTTEMAPSKNGQPRKGLAEPASARPGEPFTTSRDYQPPPGEPFYAGKEFAQPPGEPFTTSREFVPAPRDPYSTVPEEMRPPAEGNPARPEYRPIQDEAGVTIDAEGRVAPGERGAEEPATTTTPATPGRAKKGIPKKLVAAGVGGAVFGGAALRNRLGGGSDVVRNRAIEQRDINSISQPGAYTAYNQGRRAGMPSDAGLTDASTASGHPGWENVQVFVNPTTGQAEGAVNENGDYEALEDADSRAIIERIQAAGGSARSGSIDAEGNYVVSEGPVSGTGTVWAQPPPPRTEGLDKPVSPPSDPGAVADLATGASEAAGTPASGGTPLLTGERSDSGGSGSGSRSGYRSSSRYSGGGSRYGGKRKKKGSSSFGDRGGFWPGFPFNRPNSPIRQHVLDAIAASLAEGKARKGR